MIGYIARGSEKVVHGGTGLGDWMAAEEGISVYETFWIRV
jgi:hypothetical protein